MCRALLWIRSSLSRWDLAAPIQASGAYSNTGRMKPLCAATRPWWSSSRTARCKKLRRCLARVETLWRWWRKARFESNITRSNFRYSATAKAVPPNVMGGSGGFWRALEMTWSWFLAGSNLMRHFLPKSCRLSRVCCNAATFSRRSLESARVYTVVLSAKELSRVRNQAFVYVCDIQQKKGVGPNMLRWGTPARIECWTEILPPIATWRWQSAT